MAKKAKNTKGAMKEVYSKKADPKVVAKKVAKKPPKMEKATY